MGESCEGVIGFVERTLKHCFDKYARFVSRHPLPFIILPIIVTVFLLAGLVRYNYVYESEYLYTPINGPAKDERKIMETLFPNDENNLYISTRKLDLDGYIQVVLTDTTESNNIFTDEGLQAVSYIDGLIKNFTTSGEQAEINFVDVCSKWKGNCEENPIFLISDSDNMTYQYPVHNGIFLGNQIGGVRLDADGNILTAEGILLTYNVRYLDDTVEELSAAWLDQVKDMLFDLALDDINIVLQTSDSLDEELDKATQEIVPLFAATYNILCVFSLLTCMMLDWIRNKMWIALAGQVSAGLAIASGIGLVCAIGVPFASICSTMPFLLMGIGIDNMFVIVAAWRDTPVRHSVSDRMGETFSKAAVSITLTSLTDCLAFGIGAISPFRSVKFFCAYAGVACAFCYVYSITFLAGCMVYSGRHEENNRHVATCRVVDPITLEDHMPTEDGWTLKRIFCWGSAVEHENETKPDCKSELYEPSSDYVGVIPDKVLPYLTTLIEYHYARYLLKTPVKIIVSITYLTYIGVAIWSCTQLQEGLELENLAPDDSYLVDFYDNYNPLFGEHFSGRIMVAMTQSLDYTDKNDLIKINDLIQSFQKSIHFFNEPDMLEFWLYDYQTFLNASSITPSNMTHFMSILQDTFLQIPGYDRYEVDLQFNTMNTEITASRFLIQARGVQSTIEESELMEQARTLAADSQIDATVYFSAFIYWDQYVVVLVTTMTNLSIAVICVLVVSFLLVPSLNAVVMVALSICSICVGVVGFMTLWEVNLDSVSMINLVLCIGFSVDFSAHICYHFSISSHSVDEITTEHTFSQPRPYSINELSGNDNPAYDISDEQGSTKDNNNVHQLPNERGRNKSDENTDVPDRISNGDQKATEALTQLGMPIIQGALSTILAVSILSASNTYIFRTFFKVIFLVMCFGFYHAIVVLPVVLSVFNDCCCKSKTNKACTRKNPQILPVARFRMLDDKYEMETSQSVIKAINNETAAKTDKTQNKTSDAVTVVSESLADGKIVSEKL